MLHWECEDCGDLAGFDAESIAWPPDCHLNVRFRMQGYPMTSVNCTERGNPVHLIDLLPSGKLRTISLTVSTQPFPAGSLMAKGAPYGDPCHRVDVPLQPSGAQGTAPPVDHQLGGQGVCGGHQQALKPKSQDPCAAGHQWADAGQDAFHTHDWHQTWESATQFPFQASPTVPTTLAPSVANPVQRGHVCCVYNFQCCWPGWQWCT